LSADAGLGFCGKLQKRRQFTALPFCERTQKAQRQHFGFPSDLSSMQAHPIFPVMLKQLSAPFCRPSPDGMAVILDDSRRSRISVVGIVKREADLLHVDDGTGRCDFFLDDPVDTDDQSALDSAQKRYARIIGEFDPSHSEAPWRVVAIRYICQFDEIAFHAIHALYSHMRATAPVRNEQKGRRPKMSPDELRVSVLAVIRDRTVIERRKLYDEFAPANSAEAINDALMSLKSRDEITGPFTGPFQATEPSS
jgi:hypothetical protein